MDNFEKQIHSMFDHIWDCNIDHPVFEDTVGDLMEAVIQCYRNLTSAQPERKKGRWKRHNTYRGDDTRGYVDPDWRCSECGKRANINECFMYDLTDFCPNCGADMRGEEDEQI